MQNKKGQEFLQPRTVDPYRRVVCIRKPKLAEQSNVQHRHRYAFLWQRPDSSVGEECGLEIAWLDVRGAWQSTNRLFELLKQTRPTSAGEF
jgi:hypothetical protein